MLFDILKDIEEIKSICIYFRRRYMLEKIRKYRVRIFRADAAIE